MASSRPYRRLLPDDTRDYLEQAILPDLRHALVTANEVRPPNVIGFVAAGLTGRKPDGWRRPDEEPQTDVDAAFAAHFGTGAEEDGWYDPAARGALKSALLTVALESRVAEPLVNIGSRLEDSADDYAHLAPDASVQPPAPKPRAAVAARWRRRSQAAQARLGAAPRSLWLLTGPKRAARMRRCSTSTTTINP